MSGEIDVKAKLEFLRIATMIGQRIDVVWVTFLTTYVTLFGFALFYNGEIKGIYFVFILISTSIFTWINFWSLWNNYKFQNEMGKLYKELNTEFPTLNPLMGLYSKPRSEFMLVLTHTSGIGVYLFFVFEKFWFI